MINVIYKCLLRVHSLIQVMKNVKLRIVPRAGVGVIGQVRSRRLLFCAKGDTAAKESGGNALRFKAGTKGGYD